MGLEVIGHLVSHLLGVGDDGQHGVGGLHQHSDVPVAPGADLQIGRVALRRVEAAVAQQDATLLEGLDEGVEPRVVGVGGRPSPADDLARMVEGQAQLAADDPAVESVFWANTCNFSSSRDLCNSTSTKGS